MATLTLKYNARSAQAINLINYMLSTGFVTPVEENSEKNRTRRFVAAKQSFQAKKMTMEEIRTLAEQLDRENNPQRLQATPEEIDEIVKECRNGK